jgi:hypothetical protein
MKNRKESTVKARQTTRSRKSLLSFGVASVLAMTAATAQVASSFPGSTGVDAPGAEYQASVEPNNPVVLVPVPAAVQK